MNQVVEAAATLGLDRLARPASPRVIVRSTSTGSSDSMMVLNSVASSPAIVAGDTVVREVGATFSVRVTCWPSAVTNVRRTVAVRGSGLAIAIRVAWKAPVAPSAR